MYSIINKFGKYFGGLMEVWRFKVFTVNIFKYNISVTDRPHIRQWSHKIIRELKIPNA